MVKIITKSFIGRFLIGPIRCPNDSSPLIDPKPRLLPAKSLDKLNQGENEDGLRLGFRKETLILDRAWWRWWCLLQHINEEKTVCGLQIVLKLLICSLLWGWLWAWIIKIQEKWEKYFNENWKTRVFLGGTNWGFCRAETEKKNTWRKSEEVMINKK